MFRLLRYKVLAALIGVLATAGPVLLFVAWLQKQGETEVSIAANWTIGLTDLAIDRAVTTLNALAARGVASCKPTDVLLLHRALFDSDTIKALSVIGPNAQVMCTDSGTAFGTRDVAASAATSLANIKLDVLTISDSDERMLRVRRLGPKGQPSLAALLPTTLLLPQVAPDGNRFTGIARLALADGTLLAAVGKTFGVAQHGKHEIIGRKRSERYGPTVTVAMIHNGVVANYDDLRWAGMAVTGLIAFVVLVCAALIPRRGRRNPIMEIEHGLEAGEFVPYYQPIVDIKSGRLLGAEVLVRWRKPDGTIVGPGGFIALVETTGLIVDLTRTLMRQVCNEIGPAFGQRRDMYIAFNVAPRHFENSLILNDVGSILENSPIHLSQVVLEVTERCEIEDLAATRRVIAALQGLGCRIAMDDVGTGRNGLSYILKLGVDIIKIDKMFVDAIGAERHSRPIVEMLVDLARNLRMQIVAEGVENFEQVMYLRDHGISAAQGFVFAPPLPGSAFLELIAAIDPSSASAAEHGKSAVYGEPLQFAPAIAAA